jgi:hypothetical protein
MAGLLAEFQKSDFPTARYVSVFPARMKSGFVVSRGLTKFPQLAAPRNIQTRKELCALPYTRRPRRAWYIDSIKSYTASISREEYRLDGEYYANPTYVRNTEYEHGGIKRRIGSTLSLFFFISAYIINFIHRTD